MADPIEEICSKLNALPVTTTSPGYEDLPQVYADVSPQGASLPYIVVSRLNPRLSRFFGGAFQIVDFQVKQHYINYSSEAVTEAQADHTKIKDGLELQSVTGLTGSVMHRLAPYRVNVNDGNHFTIVQAWQLFFEE